MGGKRRGRGSVGKKGNEGVRAGQGRWRRGSSGKGRREGREDRGAKYLYNNRPLEERRRGWRREGGERSLRHRGIGGKGMEAEEKVEEEECGT